jgi:hypothetical protein
MFAGFMQIESETPCSPKLTREEGKREVENLARQTEVDGLEELNELSPQVDRHL